MDDSIKVENLINHHPPYECTNKLLEAIQEGVTAAELASIEAWIERGAPSPVYDEVDDAATDFGILNGSKGAVQLQPFDCRQKRHKFRRLRKETQAGNSNKEILAAKGL